jgi:hypothetical protein
MVRREHKKEKAMRKICFALVLSTILLMVSPSFAQVARQPTSSEGKTTFTNISVRGLDDDGTTGFTDPGIPGYIEMYNTKGEVLYLFIGSNNKLRIATERIVGYGASPAVVGWSDGSGVVVGKQTE